MSDLEAEMALQIRAYKLPTPEREFRFTKGRRFRFDFAWVAQKVALEVEGGVWSGGRHSRGAGFNSDCEKYALATLEGWRVFRVTTNHIKSGDAIQWIQAALSVKAGGFEMVCP